MEHHPQGRTKIIEPHYPALMMVALHGRVLSVGMALAVVAVLLLVHAQLSISAVVVALFAGGTVFCLGLFLQDIAKLLVDTLVPK